MVAREEPPATPHAPVADCSLLPVKLRDASGARVLRYKRGRGTFHRPVRPGAGQRRSYGSGGAAPSNHSWIRNNPRSRARRLRLERTDDINFRGARKAPSDANANQQDYDSQRAIDWILQLQKRRGQAV